MDNINPYDYVHNSSWYENQALKQQPSQQSFRRRSQFEFPQHPDLPEHESRARFHHGRRSRRQPSRHSRNRSRDLRSASVQTSPLRRSASTAAGTAGSSRIPTYNMPWYSSAMPSYSHTGMNYGYNPNRQYMNYHSSMMGPNPNMGCNYSYNGYIHPGSCFNFQYQYPYYNYSTPYMRHQQYAPPPQEEEDEGVKIEEADSEPEEAGNRDNE